MGNGDGMIVRRGYQPSAARTTSTACAQVPNGYIFDVITNGFGAMPDYAAQIPSRRPLGHRGLCARAAIEPECFGERCAGRQRARP